MSLSETFLALSRPSGNSHSLSGLNSGVSGTNRSRKKHLNDKEREALMHLLSSVPAQPKETLNALSDATKRERAWQVNNRRKENLQERELAERLRKRQNETAELKRRRALKFISKEEDRRAAEAAAKEERNLRLNRLREENIDRLSTEKEQLEQVTAQRLQTLAEKRNEAVAKREARLAVLRGNPALCQLRDGTLAAAAYAEQTREEVKQKLALRREQNIAEQEAKQEAEDAKDAFVYEYVEETIRREAKLADMERQQVRERQQRVDQHERSIARAALLNAHEKRLDENRQRAYTKLESTREQKVEAITSAMEEAEVERRAADLARVAAKRSANIRAYERRLEEQKELDRIQVQPFMLQQREEEARLEKVRMELAVKQAELKRAADLASEWKVRAEKAKRKQERVETRAFQTLDIERRLARKAFEAEKKESQVNAQLRKGASEAALAKQ